MLSMFHLNFMGTLHHCFYNSILQMGSTECQKWKTVWKFLKWLHIELPCCSVAKSCLTLHDSVECNMPGLPVPHHLPEFAQVGIHCQQFQSYI